MAVCPSAILLELSEKLDLAHKIVNQLSVLGPESEPNPKLGLVSQDSNYRSAEKRANAAEAQVAKLKRELENTRRSVSESVRETQRLAYQDPLTGLGNAHLLLELTDKLVGATRPDRDILVIIIDIDRFCVINQMLGHDLADELLVRMGERLLESFGSDAALGRLSEDEFVLVISDLAAREAGQRALSVGETIRKRLSRPFLVQGQEIRLTVSQGGTLGSSGGASARVLFQQARTALAYAKAKGRDQLRIYNPDLDRHLRRDASLEFQLRYALESDEFFLEYAPTVWLDRVENGHAEGRVIAVEALLRWRHRTEGVLVTADFFEAAERSGQSVAIGDRVMEMVCRDFRTWREAGVDLYATVRLSARQLLSVDLVDRAIQRATQADIPRERLTFEFDECWANLDEEQIDRNLLGLQEAGFLLVLSNFGAGASSLRRLRQVSFLKLSPSLVQDCDELTAQALVIAAGMGKVAVGVDVDSLATARFLISHGCSTVQGRPFSGPLLAGDVLNLARANSTWTL